MKNYILFVIVMLVFCINGKSQIIEEYDYDGASTIGSFANNFITSQLLMVNLEVSGERYIIIDKVWKKIRIYDINHNLQKLISFDGYIGNNNISATSFLYFSEHLFNNDDKMEFMYLSQAQEPYYTAIFNEDGNILFSDTGAAMIKMNVPLQQFPIYNTSNGTKMILSYTNNHAKVFRLPGTLTTSIVEANNNLISQSSLSNPYPNPVSNTTKVDYTLPEGIEVGELVFYDMQGIEVKRYRVDRTFNTLLISTSDIPAGTYFYQLQTAKDKTAGKKMIVIK